MTCSVRMVSRIERCAPRGVRETILPCFLLSCRSAPARARQDNKKQGDMAPPPLLQLKDIALTFGGTPLLTGAELSVSTGERVSLVGRNGSGKSTPVSYTHLRAHETPEHLV